MADALSALEEELEQVRLENSELKRRLQGQRWFESAIDATNNTVIITDPKQPDNPIVYANKGFEWLTGYSRAETLGRNCRFLQGDDAAQPAVTELREAIAAGRDARVVLRNYRKDGSMFWNELYVTAVYEEGELQHFIGVQNDITPLVEADQERALLGTAVEQADESIVITDALVEPPGSHIIYVNAAFERLTGYRRDEVIGLTPRILQGPRTDPQLLARLRRALETGEIFRGESVNYRKGGVPFINEWHIAPIGQEDVTHWVATQRDVTERRELERLVLEASALEQQRVAQDLHDILGQHLTGTAFVAASLLRRLRAGDLAGSLDAAEQTVVLVNEAISQTRGLARGLYPPELRDQGFVGALEQFCETSKGVFGIDCVVQVSGAPQVSTDEALHLYHIAQEALNNAFKHGQANRIVVHWQQDGRGRSLRISDDGVGLRETGSQQGLGLRIMRYRAQLLGGALSIEARNPGTLVHCFLPLEVSPTRKEATVVPGERATP